MTLDSARGSDGCEASPRLPTGLCGSRIRTDDSLYVPCSRVLLLDARLAADGHGGGGADSNSLVEALVALAGDYGMRVSVPDELRPKMKGSSELAKALRALDALPDAPTDLAREAGAAFSAIVSHRADGGVPTSG